MEISQEVIVASVKVIVIEMDRYGHFEKSLGGTW